ncbi:MAG: DUF4345 domain-containing protein [Candidatus Thiodiazotropha sp.]|jgi:hypothetical protein
MNKNGEGLSWEWFDLEAGDIFKKRQGSGRVKVTMNRSEGTEEIARVKFLDDITFRLQLTGIWRSLIPFVDSHTHHMLIKREARWCWPLINTTFQRTQSGNQVMTIQAVIVRATAAVFTVYGLGFVIAPELLSQYVTGASPTSASGLIDMRATYGGMSVAVGGLLIVLSTKRGSIENGLLGVIILMICMASGRIYGIVVDESANILMYIYLAIEIGMAGISWWAYVHSGKTKRTNPAVARDSKQ